jgi:hypothetical protein
MKKVFLFVALASFMFACCNSGATETVKEECTEIIADVEHGCEKLEKKCCKKDGEKECHKEEGKGSCKKESKECNKDKKECEKKCKK